MKFITTHFKTMLIVALVIFIAILLNDCRGRKNKNAEWEAREKQYLQTTKALTDTVEQVRKKYSQDSADARGREQLAAIEKQEADKKVKAHQNTIDKLVTVIRNNTGKPVDSSFVLVPPAFKEACEELPKQVENLKAANKELADANTEYDRIVKHEVKLRDDQIEKEKAYSDSVNKVSEGRAALINEMRNASKPRGRLLAGVSIMGNEKQLITGAGPVVAYQTKGGKQYQVSAKTFKHPTMESPEMFYEGTALFTIFK